MILVFPVRNTQTDLFLNPFHAALEQPFQSWAQAALPECCSPSASAGLRAAHSALPSWGLQGHSAAAQLPLGPLPRRPRAESCLPERRPGGKKGGQEQGERSARHSLLSCAARRWNRVTTVGVPWVEQLHPPRRSLCPCGSLRQAWDPSDCRSCQSSKLSSGLYS